MTDMASRGSVARGNPVVQPDKVFPFLVRINTFKLGRGWRGIPIPQQPPTMASALTDAETYGLFFESVFYGVYLVTCGFCVRTLFTTQTGLKRLRDLNWPMIVVAFLLFGIATVDAVLQFTRNLHTFQIADGPTDAANDFSAISDPVNVVKVLPFLSVCYALLKYRSQSATVCFQTTIADIMLVRTSRRLSRFIPADCH